MQVYEHIIRNKSLGRKMLAVLLDPQKHIDLIATADNIRRAGIELVFVGGSGYEQGVDDYIVKLRSLLYDSNNYCSIILFPGDVCQFSEKADALLFLSLISGRDVDLIIGKHIKTSRAVYNSGIETIPMGYILIEGGRESAVQRVTNTEPLNDTIKIVDTALAGMLLGYKLIYLEAGSGALQPVAPNIISSVSECIDVPLIVGGGICTIEQMLSAFHAGADIVVIGNYFEKHCEQIFTFAQVVEQLNENKENI